MSDNGEEEDEGPPVVLGEADPVEGAPVARVAARLHYPVEKSTVVDREGETTIRTPDGPRALAAVLDESDAVYFERRQAFVGAVRDVVGLGPVPTAGGDDEAADDADSDATDGEEDAGDGADEETSDEAEDDESDEAEAEAGEGDDTEGDDGEAAEDEADEEEGDDETGVEEADEDEE